MGKNPITATKENKPNIINENNETTVADIAEYAIWTYHHNCPALKGAECGEYRKGHSEKMCRKTKQMQHMKRKEKQHQQKKMSANETRFTK